MKSPLEKTNSDKYYQYHRDHSHDTEDCFRLKITIEKLIKAGHLVKFVNNNRPAPQDVRLTKPQQPLNNMNVVLGGILRGRDS